MSIRVSLAVAAISLAAASMAAAAPLQSGQSGYLSTKVLACPTRASLMKVMSIGETDFSAAASRAIGEGCDSLDKGTRVFVVTPSGALACVKHAGVSGCVWTASSRIVATD